MPFVYPCVLDSHGSAAAAASGGPHVAAGRGLGDCEADGAVGHDRVGFSLERVFDVSHGGAAARRAAAGRTVALDAYVLCPRVRYLDESVLSC